MGYRKVSKVQCKDQHHKVWQNLPESQNVSMCAAETKTVHFFYSRAITFYASQIILRKQTREKENLNRFQMRNVFQRVWHKKWAGLRMYLQKCIQYLGLLFSCNLLLTLFQGWELFNFFCSLLKVMYLKVHYFPGQMRQLGQK